MSIIDAPLWSLGEFVFSINTLAPDTISRSEGWRWPDQGRIGDYPIRQFVGPEAGKFTLAGTQLPEHFGAAGQVERLHVIAARGEPVALIDGAGNSLGQWSILQVQDDGTRWLTGTSTGRSVQFRVELSRPGDETSDTPGYDGAPSPSPDAVGQDLLGLTSNLLGLGALRGLFSL